MGNPCVSHSITEPQIDDNYELLCRLWSPLVRAEEGGLSTPIARSTQRVKDIWMALIFFKDFNKNCDMMSLFLKTFHGLHIFKDFKDPWGPCTYKDCHTEV